MKFLQRVTDKLTVLDAAALDLTGIPAEVQDIVAPLVLSLIHILFRRHRPVCHRRGIGGAVVGAHGRTGHLGLLCTAGRQLFYHVHPGRRKGVSDRWGRDLNMPPHSP